MDVKKLDDQAIFEVARKISSREARQAYLAQICGEDLATTERIEALLHAHDDSASFLETPPSAIVAIASPTIDQPAQEKPGTQIGPYKLLQQIGEGGMGTVYMAEQTQPVQRKVALKVIKPGMDSRQIIARFEAERQALAMMDHVNIARVLDAGATESGRPFFVMELVHGVPITKYCDDNRLTPRQRLELFVPVCQAIQHAHQKGIIHRDIKPSNVMVTLYDGKPVPKVIDFGVAKATEQKLTERTLFTQYGTMVGTLEYMSPEQAEMSALGVDTRSDIYSLGVLLYELLTGSTPLTHKRMKEAAYAEILRMIKEEEPPKPSTRLSDSGEALASISANRHTEPAKLSKLMRGELDWIVMKTLEKDRNRRYETANGFAADVQRYLNDETVQACPPSAGYRLRKFVRRNRGQVLAAGLVLLTLVGGIAGTTWGLVRAEQQRQLAEAKKQEALDERDAKDMALAAEKTAKEQTQKRLVQIEKGNEIITSIFTDLDIRKVKEGTEPLEAVLAERLVKAAGQLEGEAVGDTLVVAGLQDRLGMSLLHLGHPQAAIGLFVKARATRSTQLGADHPHTLMSMANLAVSYQDAGKLDLALPLHEETLKLRKAKLGADHLNTLASMNNLGNGYRDAGKLDLALPLYEETLKLMKAKLGADHPDTLASMSNLGSGYLNAGKLDLALPLFEETLRLTKAKLGADHPNTLTSMNNLAESFRAARKLDLALPLLEETLKLRKAELGADHPGTLVSMNNLAAGYRDAGKLDLALPLLEETLKLMKAKLGADHPDTLTSMNNLGIGYRDAGKLDLALPLLEETLKLTKAKLGADHPATLTSMANLAEGYRDAEKLELALPLYEETLKLMKAKLGAGHPSTLTSMNNLALGYQAAGKLDLALPLYEETLKLRKAKLGANHPDTLTSMNNLAFGYQDAEKLEQALPLFQEAVAGMEKRRFQHEHSGRIVNNLIGCYERLKQFDQAEPWRRKSLAVLKDRAGADSVPFAGELAALGLNLLQQKKWTDAEAVLRECLAIREKKQPDAWSTFNIKSMLGGALLGQKKYTDAEPPLVKGYEGMKQREKTIPPQASIRIPEALDRLIEFYTATNKPDEAKKWRVVRAQYPPEPSPPPRPH